MYEFAIGVIGIPCLGIGIAIIYNCVKNGTCLFSCNEYTDLIKEYGTILDKKYKEYKESRLLHEIVTDPKGHVMYYRNDGLTRDFSPLTP